MEVNKILSADVLDIIFDDRNKSYGAYDLRKTYNKRITKALVITASVAVLAFGGALLADSLGGSVERGMRLNEMTIADLKQPEEKVVPPIIPPRVEIPRVEMMRFTPPVIVKDELFDKPAPENEDLSRVKIGSFDQEGVEDDGISASADLDGNTQVIEEKIEEDDGGTYEKVEIEASFPGGESRWHQYLERNCNAQVAADNGAPEGTYTTIVQFVVDKEGTISDVHPLTNLGFGMEQEAIRVIKNGPNWKPANQNGRAVKAYRKQPITFLVQGE